MASTSAELVDLSDRRNQTTEATRLVEAGRVGRSGRARGASGSTSAAVVDPATRAVRLAEFWLRWCCVAWVVGILALMLRAASPWSGRSSWTVAFLPLWVGNVLAASVQVRVIARVGQCYNKVMVQRDYVRMLAYHAANPAALESVVPEDTVYLVTRGSAAVLLSIPVLLLVTLTEALLCLHLERGRPGLWACVLPVIVVEAAMVLQYVLIKTNTWRAGVVQTLMLVGTVLITRRASASPDEAPIPWAAALVPLWLINAVFLQLVLKILFKHATGRYHLRGTQLWCAALWIAAVLATWTGEALLCARASASEGLGLPLAITFLGVVCGAAAVAIVLGLHADWLVASKGFDEPLPLSRTEFGWGPSGLEKGYELCLGLLDKRGVRYTLDERGVASQLPSTRDFEASARGNSASDLSDTGYDSAAFNDLYSNVSTADEHETD